MAKKKSKPKTKEPAVASAPATDLDATSLWDDELLTTRELMALLKLSRTKVWELVQKENLPAFKLGGDYRYRRSEVLEWLERYRTN